ncbi:trypsin-like peptidase domain-containing protein [Streptomyces apocyni]|uniref:trypsin-like peptidase domain-containing protein n=1 Tax=Streptomyces apocyni TaxID=2654677 RepID=UPI0012EA62EB|nr:trypsin-like peptidase domain-containing protein [Streptomyces apocyni]
MDEGKPTGSKTEWWSRPRQGQQGAAATEPSPDPSPQPGISEVSETSENPEALEPSESAADAERRPLHAPDPYGTPPYGEPGPWALAPPVQHPRATPAHGTAVPPAATQTGLNAGAGAPGGAASAPTAAPASAPTAAPASAPTGAWQQYDPWSSPQPQPLLHPTGAEPAPARKPRRGALLIGALAIALLAGAVGGGVGAYVERKGGLTDVSLPQADREDKGRAPESVAGIAASAVPSVVTLHVSGGGAQGTGTGFVLDNKGHILTNNHVVDPAGSDGRITVTFSGGESAKAKLIGKDAGYDLAVVRVTGVSGLKPLPLGNSDNVQVGDPVVAIGAPFDLSNTVTSGIISAKGRPITAGGEEGDGSDVSYVDALQTDAPINPGNSGGPLVDSKARVIGINSAIRSAGGGGGAPDGGGAQAGSIGLGFAIPVNLAKRVAEELINTGKATHPVIEVTLDTQFTGEGARVADETRDGGPAVKPGGPADQAGVKPGDIITAVDGQRVRTGQELIVKIRAHRPGDRLELTLERDGAKQTLSLELGSADAR